MPTSGKHLSVLAVHEQPSRDLPDESARNHDLAVVVAT